MLPENIRKYKIILASNSPRRQQVLHEMGIHFEVRVKPVDEIFPPELTKEAVAIFLSELKAKAFLAAEFEEDELLITADTIVCLGDEILNKPNDREHAIEMLTKLSGRKHEVITGVCLRSKEKMTSFAVSTQVYFRELSKEEIMYYVDVFQPFDKAGSYGIQEWIGFVGITKIEGSYFNVVGFPTEKIFEALKNF
jgi:septum formation protein